MFRGACLGSGQGTASVAEQWALVTLCSCHYTGGCETLGRLGHLPQVPTATAGQADEAGRAMWGPNVNCEALASGEEGQGGRFPLSAPHPPSGRGRGIQRTTLSW